MDLPLCRFEIRTYSRSVRSDLPPKYHSGSAFSEKMGTRHGLYSTQVKNEVYEVKILVFVDRTSWSVGHRFGKIFASLWFCQLGFEAAAGNSTLTRRQRTGKGRGGR